VDFPSSAPGAASHFCPPRPCNQLTAKGLFKSPDPSSGIPDASICTSSLVLNLRARGDRHSQRGATRGSYFNPTLAPPSATGSRLPAGNGCFRRGIHRVDQDSEYQCHGGLHRLRTHSQARSDGSSDHPCPIARLFQPRPQRNSSHRSEGLAPGVGGPDASIWLGIPPAD
jgi:hypothetical protein